MNDYDEIANSCLTAIKDNNIEELLRVAESLPTKEDRIAVLDKVLVLVEAESDEFKEEKAELIAALKEAQATNLANEASKEDTAKVATKEAEPVTEA